MTPIDLLAERQALSRYQLARKESARAAKATSTERVGFYAGSGKIRFADGGTIAARSAKNSASRKGERVTLQVTRGSLEPMYDGKNR